MRKWLTQGRGRREGAIDGLNLFFGALLGANLGTLDGLKLVTYVQLVTLLAGTVMALRVACTAEKRAPALAVLALYVALLIALVKLPGLQPAGLATEDLHRLAATLALWVTFVIVLEVAARQKDVPAAEKEAM